MFSEFKHITLSHMLGPDSSGLDWTPLESGPEFPFLDKINMKVDRSSLDSSGLQSNSRWIPQESGHISVIF